jgi:hypothetical protein
MSIRRREFLALGAAAGVLVLRPRGLAARAALPPLNFVVISDTHLGYRDQTHAEEQWEKTAAEISQADGDFVLHLGDVVDGGREEQYPKYLAIRRKIERPVYEIPGNHDPQELFEKHLRSPVDAVVEREWLRLLLLNNSRTDSHDGFLSDAQIAWLDEQCNAAGDKRQLALIAMHVPAHTNRHPDRGWFVQPQNGQQRFYDVLDRHRDQVLALFHGHFHNGLRGWDDRAPVHEICFPSALYNQDRKLESQMAPGYNLPEFRPVYTLVSIAEGAMRLRCKPVGEAASVEKSCAVRPIQ